MDIQSINSFAGLISLGMTLVVSIVGAFFFIKSNVAKDTSSAQSNAISAMQAEITIQKSRIDDLKAENVRLGQIIETICSALKKKGFVITIEGEMVSIEDKNGISTTTRIRSEIHTKDD